MIRMRAVSGLAGLVLLSACLQTPTTDAAKSPNLPAPLLQADLAGGDVVVAGPSGYCIDPVTLGRFPGRGFAVIASCNILSGGKSGIYVEPMVMTVAVGPKGGGTILPPPRSLAEEAGESLLAGGETDGLVTAQLAGGGSDVLPDGDPRHWRGLFVQNDHLVALGLYAPRDSALAGRAGAGILRDVYRRIRALSGQPAARVPADQAQSPKSQGNQGNLLARLFGPKQ